MMYPSAEKIKSDKDHLKFLKESLGSPKKADILFRGTDHGFNATKFHELCGNKQNTLTVVRTEYKKTIFAFSVMAWNAATNNYAADASNKSCIIWLHPRTKLTHQSSGNNAILCNSGYGPTFGTGHDLWITGDNIYTAFPVSYNNGSYGAQSQINYTLMLGAPHTNSCKILEYEVYALTF